MWSTTAGRAAKCGTSTCGRPPWSSKNPKRLKKNRPPVVGHGACVFRQHHRACVWRRRPDHMLNEISHPLFWKLNFWRPEHACPCSPQNLLRLYNTQNPLTGLATMAEFHIQLLRSNSSHTVLTKCLNCLNQNLDAEIIFKSFFCNKSDQFVFFVFCSEVCAWNRQQKLTKDSKIIF